MVRSGDDLCEITLQAAAGGGMRLEDGDIIVLAQKIVSTAEGRLVALADVVPGPAALELAAETGKDPRLLELVLSEAEGLVRVRRGW